MGPCLCSVCSRMHVDPLMIGQDPFLMVCCPHSLTGGPDTKSVGPKLLPNKLANSTSIKKKTVHKKQEDHI